MNGASIRKLIVSVLLLACSIVSVLLLRQQSDNTKSLSNLNMVDSLIASALQSFNINKSAYHIETVSVTPHFKRKVWYVSLPVNLSQTFFHYDLAQKLYPYDIRTPAKVNLKNGMMDIQVYYHDTVIRTVSVSNDTSAVRYNMPGSIILTFNQRPNEDVTDLVKSLGEPILLAFKTNRVVQTDSWLHVSGIEDFNVAFWIEPESSQNHKSDDKWYLGEQVRNLTKMLHHPQILIGPDVDDNQRRLWITICQARGLRMIDASDALWLASDASGRSVTNMIQRFYKQASLGHRPILIMSADKKNISELKQTIPDYRKRGLIIVPPSHNVEQ